MKRKRIRNIVIVVFLAAFAAVGVWANSVFASLGGNESHSFLPILDPNIWGGIKNPRSQFHADQIHLLLVGRDYNRDRQGMGYTKQSRADTIMMLQLDLEKGTVTGLSIPRDTKVRARDGITSKINATLTRKDGMNLLVDTVSDLLGVRPDYTVLIKADAVREIVNAVGGIDVETLDEMHYHDYWGQLHIDLPKGEQHITGEQAVGFTRFREVNVGSYTDENGEKHRLGKTVHSKEEGDARRMARQQQLIKAIMGSAKSLSNIARAPSIIDTGYKQLDTNLTRMQMLALATIFKSSESSQIKTATLLGGEENGEGGYYFLPDEKKTEALVEYLFKNNDVAGNQLCRVAVYNGTGVKGVAKAAAEMLEQDYFDAFSGGNRDATPVSRVVFRTALVEDRAKAIAAKLGITDVHKATPEEAKIEILGSTNDPDVYVTIGDDLATGLVATTVPEEPPVTRRSKKRSRART